MAAPLKRKIIAYIAVSADGYIARPDGDVKWLDRPKGSGDYGMADFYKTIDTIIMGKKTYDLGLTWGQTSYPGKKNYVFTRSSPAPAKDIEFVNENVGGFVERVRKQKGKDIWLVGGAALNGAFLDAGGHRRIHHSRHPGSDRRWNSTCSAPSPRVTARSGFVATVRGRSGAPSL